MTASEFKLGLVLDAHHCKAGNETMKAERGLSAVAGPPLAKL